jgi:hypothetical protein
VAFVAVGAWLARKFKGKGPIGELQPDADALAPATLSAMLPLFSATLPFLLLIMAVQRLRIVNPSSVFGLALLLTVLLLGLTILLSVEWLPAVGLACVVALEASWHFKHFDVANATTPLSGISPSSLCLPRSFRLHGAIDRKIPWAAAAMAGPPQFF